MARRTFRVRPTISIIIGIIRIGIGILVSFRKSVWIGMIFIIFMFENWYR